MIDDFAADGQLAKAIPGFKPREPQRQMAVAVSKRLGPPGRWWWKRGTGTGKTYAYLAPALRAKKVMIISTGSKALGSALQPRSPPSPKRSNSPGNWRCSRALQLTCVSERLERQALAGGDLPVQTLSDVILLRSWSESNPGWRYQHLRQPRKTLRPGRW